MKILFVEFVLILRYVAVEAAFVEVNSAGMLHTLMPTECYQNVVSLIK